MKKFFICTSILFSTFFLVRQIVAAEKYPESRISDRQTYSQRATSAPGKTLYVDMYQANLVIAGTAQNDIVAEATVELSETNAERMKTFFSQTQLVLEPYRQGFRVTLRSPRDQFQRRSDSGFRRLMNLVFEGNTEGFSMATELRLQVPSNQSLIIENKYGDVTLESVNGALEVGNTSGEIDIARCQGTLRLQNNYAATTITDFQGSISVSNNSGAVTLTNVTGDASVESSYKSVRFAQIGGALTIDAPSSEVSGNGVKGDCVITSSYKPISVARVGGKLTINGQSSAVTVSDVRNDVVIESSYQPIRVDSVAGALRLKGQSSAVTARVIAKDVSILTSYHDILVEQVGGSLKIDGNSCNVTVSDVKNDV
jgi:hypothetical protein